MPTETKTVALAAVGAIISALARTAAPIVFVIARVKFIVFPVLLLPSLARSCLESAGCAEAKGLESMLLRVF